VAQWLLFIRNLIEPALNNESPIERQILDYLTKHPAAQDTLRGIVEWWLLRQNIEQSTADVEAALDGLVAKGKIGARTGPDGRVHYGRPRKAAKENLENN
jgi:hypothetical protein